jgi:hypothetical protein
MGLKYRWMQKKDLDKINNKEDLLFLLKNNKIIANVVESNEEVLGWIVYKSLEKKVRIAKMSFTNEEIANEIIDYLINKNPDKKIEVAVSEYDLRFHLILKQNNFIAKEIKKIQDSDFYIFTRNAK